MISGADAAWGFSYAASCSMTPLPSVKQCNECANIHFYYNEKSCEQTAE
jgi:hypothetical protein